MRGWRVGTGIGLCVMLAAIAVRAEQAVAPPGPYRNLQVLRNMPAGGVDAVMQAMNRALGVECSHCHVADAWHLETKAPFGVARRMLQMVDVLNAGTLKDTDGVSCWTCHAGQRRPSRLPPASFEAVLATWPEALATTPEGTRLGMAVYTASLGVTCDYCHVAGDWKASTRAAYRIVAAMNAMFEVFPKFMPASARTQCFMCHKGTTSPLRLPPPRSTSSSLRPVVAADPVGRAVRS